MVDEQKQAGIEQQRIELRELFSSGVREARPRTATAAGSLDETLQKWNAFAEMVKGYVADSREYGSSINLKMKGMQELTTYEKFLTYFPIIGGGIADRHMRGRLKRTTLADDINMFLDNVELYSQAVELARGDLITGIGELDQKRSELIEKQEKGTQEIEQYAPLLRQTREEYASLESRLATASDAEKAELQRQLQAKEKEVNDYELKVGTATLGRKSAAEQYEYSKGIQANFETLVQTLQYEGVILQTIVEDASLNMQKLATGLAAVRVGAGGVKMWEMSGKIQSEGIDVLGKGTATLSAETSKALTGDMYDHQKLAKSIDEARGGREILRKAIVDAYEKYQAQK